MTGFVIIGSGLAGHRAAIDLRARDPHATITLIGEEAGLPYDRPPLAKGVLTGQTAPDAVMLADRGKYASLDINLLEGVRAERIDRRAASITLQDGRVLPYDKALLATGSRPRLLTCAPPSANVLYLRTLDDAVRIRERIAARQSLVIVGGGFIGLEVAAAARSGGCEVTVVEAGTGLVGRSMPGFVGRFLRQVHARHGVTFALGTAVTAVDDLGAAGVACETSSGTIRAGCAVIGIGVVPNVELATEAELAVDNGIVVDAHCRTSDPSIFAAGEATAFPRWDDGRLIRQESWRIAAEQSKVAAANMCGVATAFDDIPWMWTDQYDQNIQCLGLPDLNGQLLVRMETEKRGWVLLSMRQDGSVAGLVAANSGRDVSQGRRFFRSGKLWPPEYMSGFRRFDAQDQSDWLASFAIGDKLRELA